MTGVEQLLPIAQKAVDLAADLLRTQPSGTLTAKGDRDYASEVDYTIEREVRAFLGEATPSIGFLGEEEGLTSASGTDWWTLDPIDGTVNFAHTVPLCGVSLALVREDRPVLGVIDLSFLDARYHAVVGHGAFRDGQPLEVQDVGRIDEALLTIGDFAVGNGAEERNRLRLAVAEQLAGRALRVRMLGSAAVDLAWLAEGKTNASVTLSNRPWDVAAGVVLAREAGAKVVDLDGSDYSMRSSATIATCPGVYDELRELIGTARRASMETDPPPVDRT